MFLQIDQERQDEQSEAGRGATRREPTVAAVQQVGSVFGRCRSSFHHLATDNLPLRHSGRWSTGLINSAVPAASPRRTNNPGSKLGPRPCGRSEDYQGRKGTQLLESVLSPPGRALSKPNRRARSLAGQLPDDVKSKAPETPPPGVNEALEHPSSAETRKPRSNLSPAPRLSSGSSPAAPHSIRQPVIRG